MIDKIKKAFFTTAPGVTIFIRFMVGGIFFAEGIQKFIYPGALGAGRFAQISIPSPEVMGPFVGLVEIVCGGLILLGFLTRLAAILLLSDISVAILSTKVPILLGYGYWIFTLPRLSRYGFWSMVHEVRADFSMLLGLIFLVIVGAGSWSIDKKLAKQDGGAV